MLVQFLLRIFKKKKRDNETQKQNERIEKKGKKRKINYCGIREAMICKGGRDTS